MLAFITIQPHINHKKAGNLTPEKLLPFAWDKEKRAPEVEAPKLTPDEQRARMKKLVEQLGDELI